MIKSSKLRQLVKQARSKLAGHPELTNYPHYTYIFSKTGELLGGSTNAAYEPPKHWGYHRRGFRPKLHAEIRAYLKCKRRLAAGAAFTVVNIRLTKDGELKKAAPCANCYELLTKLGCTGFVFSNGSEFAPFSVA